MGDVIDKNVFILARTKIEGAMKATDIGYGYGEAKEG